MAASRNRGKKKPKLRDYSHLVLTEEEKEAVSAAAHSLDQHPIVTAILGYVLVEHELDILLRKKFKKKDDDTWAELQSEQGPLRSFSAKISIGYSLGIYDEKVQRDLNIVRVIRNAFAHSKKLLDFNDPLVVQEMLGALRLSAKFKKHLRKNPTNQLAKASFIVICLKLQTTLLRKLTSAAEARNYRLRKKASKSALTNALLGNPYRGILHSADLVSDLRSSLGGQSANPNPSVPKGYANALLPFLDDKKK
jgi:DNA-binding MltR family transcriptional regulator